MGRENREIVAYDFSSPHRLSREAASGVRRVHEVVSRDLELVLGDLFDSDVRGSVVAVEQSRYEQFVERLPPRAYHAVLATEGLESDVLLVLPDTTALAVIDRLLQQTAGSPRPLTLVDQHLLARYVPTMLAAVDQALRPYHPVQLTVARSELNAQLVKLSASSELVIVVEFMFSLGEHDLQILLVYPHTTLDPVLAAVSDLDRAATQEAIVRSSPIRQGILRVPLQVTVRMPSVWLPATELSSLAVGDVVQTGVPADAAPILTIAGRPALSVRTTTQRSRLACVVTGRIGNDFGNGLENQ